jgi:hypothetical protein
MGHRRAGLVTEKVAVTVGAEEVDAPSAAIRSRITHTLVTDT